MNRSIRSRSPLRLFILSLGAITLLTSCASIGRQFELTGINQITIGTSKMSEVRSNFGNPFEEIDVATRGYKRVHFGDEKTATIWAYIYANGSVLGAAVRELMIDFDGDGRVIDYSYSSSFDKDKTKEPEESERKDFDIFLAKKRIIPKKTTQSEVLSLLGKNYREMLINKPGTKIRWIYSYSKRSTDEKVLVPVSSAFVPTHSEEVSKFYGKGLWIDFNAKGIVTDIRGESDFPEDKDKFFTK